MVTLRCALSTSKAHDALLEADIVVNYELIDTKTESRREIASRELQWRRDDTGLKAIGPLLLSVHFLAVSVIGTNITVIKAHI